MIEVNLLAAVLVVVLVVVVTIILSLRIGLGTAAKFVASLLGSPVIMSAISSLEKSVPSTVIDILLGGLDLGEATTPNADLKALLDAIEELIKQNKATQAMLAAQTITLPGNAPLVTINQPPPTGTNSTTNVIDLTTPIDSGSAGVG